MERETASTMKYLSPTDIAARLGISRSKVYRIIHDIPRTRLGKRCVRVSERDLELYLLNNQERPWVASTDDTPTETGTETTAPPKDDESKEASEPKTKPSPRNASVLPSWARPLGRVVKSKG